MSTQNESVVVTPLPKPMNTKKSGKKRSFRKPFLTQCPGHLNSQGTLQIKTRAAQRHFLHLLKFAKEIKIIYRAAKHDDPYADACLLDIETALEKAQDFIQEKIHVYQPLIPTSSSLSLPLADTPKPLELPIYFATPYAHIAARVLVEFDTLMRCIISLYQWGLLSEMPLNRLVQQLSQPLFDLWKTTKHFQLTGLTRAALTELNSVSNAATSSMKPLDPQIVNKERRAKYAPRILFTTPKHNATEVNPPKKPVFPPQPLLLEDKKILPAIS